MRLQQEHTGKIKEKSGEARKKSRKLAEMEKTNKRQTGLLEQRTR